MGEGIERYRIIPEGVNPLQVSWPSLLVPLKSWIVDKSQYLCRFSAGVVCCEASIEARLNDEVGQGSETTKSGIDEQKRYTEAT